MVVAHEADGDPIDLDPADDEIIKTVKDVFGPEGSDPADYLYLFEEEYEKEDGDDPE